MNVLPILLAWTLAGGVAIAAPVTKSIEIVPVRLTLDARLHLGPVAGGMTPDFDLSGTWTNGGVPMRIRQNGASITFTYTKNSRDLAFSGRYVSPTVIVGRFAPSRDPVSGCTTTTAVRIDVANGDGFLLRSRTVTTDCPRESSHAEAEPTFKRLCIVCFDQTPKADPAGRRFHEPKL